MSAPKDTEWKVSLNHPKISSELRATLFILFERLASFSAKLSTGPLTESEEAERIRLTKLHSDFRAGRGVWKSCIGKKYFDRKYEKA